MTRVKRGVTQTRHHKKILKLAKGYRGGRSKLFREAKRAVMKAGLHAFTHRRAKKRDFRSLWIIRINSALKEQGIKYNRFIQQATLKKMQIDRKMLSELAMNEIEIFKKVAKEVMA
ncbi:50S ribosomal protein L20 [Candidatus Peregrinibacteria bacterium RIFOXYB2_FULL_32_7]|nr:MAG: 50S ribosomal protein L20 [Candidatus Peregrinibacteria bacterium RIFOXYB2_FULL_32_7]